MTLKLLSLSLSWRSQGYVRYGGSRPMTGRARAMWGKVTLCDTVIQLDGEE